MSSNTDQPRRTNEPIPPVPDGAFNEEPFTYWLVSIIDPVLRPDVAAIIVAGLTLNAPEAVRQRVAAGDVWGWTCNGSAAPDFLLGDANNRAIAMLEFKSRTAATNWLMLSTYRAATKGTDALSVATSTEILLDTPSKLDAPHYDHDCIPEGHGCRSWKWKKGVRLEGERLHYPAIHQGDLYATTTDFIPAELGFSTLREVPGIFVAPHEKATKDWQDGLRSTEHWSITSMGAAVEHWQTHAVKYPDLAVLIDAAKRVTGL